MIDKIIWRLRQPLKRITSKKDIDFLNGGAIPPIVANNCFGGEIYKRLKQPFNTPFIGLFVYGSDFVKLVGDLENYLSFSLYFVDRSKWTDNDIDYPVGLLNDVEIHFMHYENEAIAGEKWERRVKRLLAYEAKEDFIIKFCDRDGGADQDFKSFHELSYEHKISFGTNNYDHKNHIKINKNDNGRVPDGVDLYRICQYYFDLYHWIKTGDVQFSLYSWTKALLRIA
ncbi:DUF1919 domain-containing protein [Winogradskyella aurantiaca]|uniref:DUF1919 domain-containing protein n=1 Tax=Winogradskyella aurantiaca TaxID=2219558 RepID=UPI000E1DCEAD|nr:DUF1919 domain-containing protein [Winogradskyella aurantiaca]